jgi:hypothetical protein
MVVTYSLSPAHILGPIVAGTVFGALATISTVVRLYAMHLKGLRPGVSEVLLLSGVVSCLPLLECLMVNLFAKEPFSC